MAQRGDNSQDELEYFSAEESVSLTDSSEYVEFQDLSVGTTDARQPGTTMEENSPTIHITPSTDSQSERHYNERKQGRSKKQKRRWRNKLKSLQPTFDFPFQNIDIIDNDFFEFLGISNKISRSHVRNIPTLFNLCLDALTIKQSFSKLSKMCYVSPAMKDVLCYKQADLALMNIQQSWLLQLLYYFEHTDEELEISDIGRNMACRNIWNSRGFDSELISSYDWLGEPDSSVLLFTNQCYQVQTSMVFLNPPAFVSVVASVIESMLPEHISVGRLSQSSQNCRSESQLLQKTTDTMVSSVRDKFRKRYPKIYKYLFDRALPYVFWARGNISLAAECFMRLAQTMEEEPYKAMILNEAARLYAQNDESSRAYRLYMESPRAVDGDTSTHSLDLILQKYMLMASIYDQGPMTPAKAVLAAETWNTAMAYLDASCPMISATRAVESFLCFHSGTAVESVQDRLEGCVKLIERLVGSCEVLLLHLSLVKALLGDDKGSTKVYKSLISSFSSRRDNPNPWQPVLDQVKNCDIPNIMKVIWRTQLSHLRIVRDKYCFEGDYQSMADLNLRLTDAGFLTADLQMVLPPIRALNLDPYTGFNFHTPRQTHAWHSISEICPQGICYLRGLYLVPTLSELYRDETGNTVHFLAPYAYETSAFKRWKTETKPVKLFWTGANGQRANVNLSKLVKQLLKQKTTFEIFSDPDRPKKWKEDMLVTTEYCLARGYNPNLSTVTFVYCYLWDKVVASSQYIDRYGELSKPEKRKAAEVPEFSRQPHMFMAMLTEYYSFKDTLYLSLSVEGENKNILVFVDCTNEATFLEPVLTMDYHGWKSAVDDPSMSSIQVLKAVKKHRQFPQDEIMWRIGRTSPSDTSIICNPITADEILSEEFPAITTLLFGGNKIMVVTNSAIYFLHPDTLQTLNITRQQDSSSLEVSEDGRYISFLPGSLARILEQKKLEEKTRLAVGIGATLMFVDVTDNAVEVGMDLLVPGVPTEVYTISAHAGFLVTFKIQLDAIELQREHVFHYDSHGKILGVLPFLGPGPRCFCVEYLKGQEDEANTDSECGRRGWHVFMRDGHQGIIGVRL
ncbi:uncharacterized protein LOC124137453 isoform X2 [Haliotis rufescens]|uniref:uncharacterized protein LOC124137453 isoform X2 n=1 Tax=Haliotis rufescens TaxID=6454 RepID=UPI00201EBE98|nr:uncharacterized protein LOC124137453 isoform X2 [Haliotis rufescens]